MRALLALGVAVAAAVPPAPASDPSSVVRVDFVAFDGSGRMVEGLGPADVEVAEDGVAQTIDAVRFITLGGRAALSPDEPAPIHSDRDEQEQAALENGRLFAFFLDEYHVSAAATDRVRELLSRFADRELDPRDLVAVVKPLDSLPAIRVTRDRQAIHRAIDSFQGRLGEYEPRNTFERNFLAGTPERIEPVRAQVATSALNALVLHLGKLNQARKTIIVVSEGFAAVGRRRGMEGLPTLDTIVRAATRDNVSLNTVDPREAAASQASQPGPGAADALRALADGTGGRVIDPADLDGGLRQVAADSRAYYLVTYRSHQKLDGRFREVQVRVKRPGVTVRADKGYWAPEAHEVLAAELAARGAELANPKVPPGFEAPQRLSRMIRPWVGVSRGEAGKTRVTFVWEPVASVPGVRSRTGEPYRIVLDALAADGTSVFGGAVVASGTAGPDRTGDAARAVFDVAPGRVRLRMSIEDAASQVIDSDIRDISVRDLKDAVTIGSVQILRTRNAREFRALDADPDAPPVAAREFLRTERLILRVPAYSPGAAPRVTATLMSRMGQVMRDLPVKPPSSPEGLYRIDLPLASFAPGEYLIELTATSPAGQVKDRVGFRVS